MGENYIVINGKRAELTEEQLQQLGIKVSNNKRWRGNLYEKYYRVNTFNQVSSLRDVDSDDDTWLYDSHNYFKTREDANKYARVLETEMLLRKYADEHNDELTWCSQNNLVYNIYYDYEYDNVTIGSWIRSKFPHTVYFSSEEIVRDALEKIGEERIKEYLTYEW